MVINYDKTIRNRMAQDVKPIYVQSRLHEDDSKGEVFIPQDILSPDDVDKLKHIILIDEPKKDLL